MILPICVDAHIPTIMESFTKSNQQMKEEIMITIMHKRKSRGIIQQIRKNVHSGNAEMATRILSVLDNEQKDHVSRELRLGAR